MSWLVIDLWVLGYPKLTSLVLLSVPDEQRQKMIVFPSVLWLVIENVLYGWCVPATFSVLSSTFLSHKCSCRCWWVTLMSAWASEVNFTQSTIFVCWVYFFSCQCDPMSERLLLLPLGETCWHEEELNVPSLPPHCSLWYSHSLK